MVGSLTSTPDLIARVLTQVDGFAVKPSAALGGVEAVLAPENLLGVATGGSVPSEALVAVATVQPGYRRGFLCELRIKVTMLNAFQFDELSGWDVGKESRGEEELVGTGGDFGQVILHPPISVSLGFRGVVARHGLPVRRFRPHHLCLDPIAVS